MSNLTVSNVMETPTYQSTAKIQSGSAAQKTEAVTAKSGDAAVKENEAASAKENVTGVIYEKAENRKNGIYTINKMSAEDRQALVTHLKAEQDARKSQLVNLVSQMMGKQATTFAQSDESMWKFLAGGNFTVDAETKAQAQADIAEDGYWGVKQTSQRLFDFASALAGDDVDKMKEMQKAMEKGFKMATGTWGKDLPEICQQTMGAANKLFEDYYASKETQVIEE